MKKALFTAACAASLMAFGCNDKKDEQHAATPETDKAADKVADKAVDTAQGMDKVIKGGANEMKQGVDKMSDQAVNAENLRGNMQDLTGKLKQALQDKKFDDAQNFVQQLKDLKGKLPADAQTQIDTLLADADKQIAAGKALMGGAGK